MRITTEIRNKMAERLENLAYFNKVYKQKRSNISDQNLPAVSVISGAGVYSNGTSETDHTVRLEIRAKDVNIQDALDAHAEVVEPLFKVGDTLDGLIEWLRPDSFDYILDDDSDVGVMVLDFNVKYEVNL